MNCSDFPIKVLFSKMFEYFLKIEKTIKMPEKASKSLINIVIGTMVSYKFLKTKQAIYMIKSVPNTLS